MMVFFICMKRGETMNEFLTWGIQTAVGISIAVLAYFIKKNIDKIEKSIEANEKKIDLFVEKYDEKLEKTEEKNDKKFDEIQSTINKLKEDLPKEYVIRDDFIRAMSNVDQKLDKIYDIITSKKEG